MISGNQLEEFLAWERCMAMLPTTAEMKERIRRSPCTCRQDPMECSLHAKYILAEEEEAWRELEKQAMSEEQLDRIAENLSKP